MLASNGVRSFACLIAVESKTYRGFTANPIKEAHHFLVVGLVLLGKSLYLWGMELTFSKQTIEHWSISEEDKDWLCAFPLTFPHEDHVALAIKCARSVLYVFEDKYPDDSRPRKAIEAAEAWLLDPSEKSLLTARIASEDAFNSAYSARLDTLGNGEESSINAALCAKACAYTTHQVSAKATIYAAVSAGCDIVPIIKSLLP